MLLIPVASSDIAAIGYDPTGLEVQIQFTNNRIYSYQPVSPDWYAGFLAAPSKGSYVAQTLRKFPGTYPYKRIDGGMNVLPPPVQAPSPTGEATDILTDIEHFEGLI